MSYPNLFISHSSKDQKIFVDDFVDKLKKEKVNVWYYKHDTSFGDIIPKGIFEDGFKNCDYFLIIISENIVGSNWVDYELNLAIYKFNLDECEIIPIVIDSEDNVPEGIRLFDHAVIKDLNNYESTFKKILERIGIFKEIKKEFDESKILDLSETNFPIKTLMEFKEENGKNQPSLLNPFVSRDLELKKSMKILENNDILVFYGDSGIGKSKLSAQVAEDYLKLNFEICVLTDLSFNFKKLKESILPNSKILFILDDLNGDFTDLNSFIKIMKLRDDLKLKFIINIRDYYFTEIKNQLKNISFGINFLHLEKLESGNISKIIEDSFSKEDYKLNPQFVEQITDISKGNPRIAIMAIESYEKDSEINIVQIFKNYFENIKSDVSFLKDNHILTSFAILSFFGILNKDNENISQLLEKEFNINWEELWVNLSALSKLEFIELHEDKIAKISNQALSNYILYLTFFEKELFDLKKWVDIFVENNNEQIYSMIVELTNSFGEENLEDKILTSFNSSLNEKEKYAKENLKFFKVFWYYFKDNTIVFLENWINGLSKEEKSLDDIKISSKPVNLFETTSELDLLSNFYRFSEYSKTSLELSLNVIKKQPSLLIELSENLFNIFIYHKFDYKNHYKYQNILIDFLVSSRNKEDCRILDKMFLAKIPNFFDMIHFLTEQKTNFQINFINIYLHKSDDLMILREKIILKLLFLYDDYPQEVLEGMQNYVNSIYRCEDQDIEIYDKEKFLFETFFNSKLSFENYSEIVLIKNYFDALQKKNITVTNLDSFLNSDLMNFSKIYSAGYIVNDLTSKNKDYTNLINEDINGKDIQYIKNILDKINHIYITDGSCNEKSVSILFKAIAKEDQNLLLNSFKYYLEQDFNFGILKPCVKEIYKFIIFNNILTPLELYKLLNNYEYKYKQIYNQIFFETLYKNLIDKEILNKFIEFMQTTDGNFNFWLVDEYYKFNDKFLEFQNNFDDAKNYNNIISYITHIQLNKPVENRPNFDPYFCKEYGHYFDKNVELLKLVFLTTDYKNRFGTESEELQAIFEKDKTFITEYLNEKIKKMDYWFDLETDLTFLWDYENIEDYIDEIIDLLIKQELNTLDGDPAIVILFKNYNSKQKNNIINYLMKIITKNIDSNQYIHDIMHIVRNYFEEEFINFFKLILNLNPSNELFESINLIKNEHIISDIILKYENDKKFIIQIKELVGNNYSVYNEYIIYLDELILHLDELILKQKENKFSRML